MLYVIEDIGSRPYQEDRHCVKLRLYENYQYVAVFDGHGGDEVSEFCKFHMPQFVVKHLSMGKTPSVALRDAFNELNSSMPLDICNTTGSTAVVILKRDTEIWVANAGDSRAILVDKNTIALSEDHKPTRPSEFDRITKLGGKISFFPNDVPRVQGNLAISRSLGDKYLYPYVIGEPEIRQFVLSEDAKYIILATDGLWDVFNNIEVGNLVKIGMQSSNKTKKILAHDTINELLKIARERGSGDNVTIMCWVL